MKFISYITKNISKKKKIIFSLTLIGFLLKYNYFNWYIFHSTSFFTLIIKNLVVILFSIISINFLFKNKKNIIYTFIIYTIFSSFFFANLWYHKYFGDYLSVADITMGQGIRPFKVLFRQLISWLDLLFIFEFPLLIYLIFFKGSFSRETINIRENRKYRKKVLIILLLIIVLLGIHIFNINNLYAVNGFLELYEHSTPAFVSAYGIIPLYIAEYISMQIQQEEVKQITDNKISGEEELSREYTVDNIKNIIVIQLESFDEKIIGYEYNNQEITPFLNKLKKKSLYFNNIYAQHVNGSFDAEFSFLTSLYPVNKNYVFKSNDMTEFNSLVKVLKNRNYNILAFHGNKDEFFYRDKGYPEMGFDKFYHRKYFSTKNAEIGKESYLGINDYDFFDQSIKYLRKAEKPFFAFYITVTSHTPFDFYPEKYRLEKFNNIDSTLLRDYFNSVHFTDQSIKNFFKRLKEKNLYQDTLFVFYSDHNAGVNKENYSSESNFIMEASAEKPENIPLMIFHPEIKNKTINKSGTHTDIAPTILDIMGNKEKPEGFLGVSLLKEKENPVLFLHERPQILYHNNLFLKMPKKPEKKTEFKRVGYKENAEKIDLPQSEKQRMIDIIAYVRKIMKTNISEEE